MFIWLKSLIFLRTKLITFFWRISVLHLPNQGLPVASLHPYNRFFHREFDHTSIGVINQQKHHFEGTWRVQVCAHTRIYIYIYVCVWHCMYVCIWYHINSHLDPHVSLVKQRFVPCEIINTGPLFCSRRVTARSAGCQRSARVTPWMTWDVGMFQHHHVHQEQKCHLEIYPPSNHQIDFGGEKDPKFTNSKFTNLWCWIRNDWSQFSMALRIETQDWNPWLFYLRS